MKDISSLAKKPKAYLPLHQARITFIAQLVMALLRSRSTNLYHIADELQDNDSSYRRIKRFLADYDYSFEQLSELILSCLDMNRFTLCMDRTNWEHGSKNINYLVVPIAWQETSTPIV
ncbi:MAG: hypothetical protein QS721_00620 [Candidatus Endonucleobacter sp. (ex Gigantidas childressi)]|nr:hypothetical protein [Candidatus Endonucleobacter sp. (ex Gigantidas childressi)]